MWCARFDVWFIVTCMTCVSATLDFLYVLVPYGVVHFNNEWLNDWYMTQGIPSRSYIEAINRPTIILYGEHATDEPFAWICFSKEHHSAQKSISNHLIMLKFYGCAITILYYSDCTWHRHPPHIPDDLGVLCLECLQLCQHELTNSRCMLLQMLVFNHTQGGLCYCHGNRIAAVLQNLHMQE